MNPPPDPALVDFGGGRRLERYGGWLVDRPHPAAIGSLAMPSAWKDAAAVFEDDSGDGSWKFASPLPDPWLVRIAIPAATELRLHARPAPSGQLGIFLEHLPAWRWLAARCRPGDRILSLFAHTGGATLAAAAAGAEVFHVDASRQAIRGARENAAASGLSKAPIHWVQEDAARYCSRLLRRGDRFRGIVLDPPSYGHGPGGEAFSIDRDLEPLLGAIANLRGDNGFVFVSCHSKGWDAKRLSDVLEAAHGEASPGQRIDAGGLFCEDASGRRLDLGWFARSTHRAEP